MPVCEPVITTAPPPLRSHAFLKRLLTGIRTPAGGLYASDARVVDEISRVFGINLASYRLSAPVTADECADDIVVRFDQLVA